MAGEAQKSTKIVTASEKPKPPRAGMGRPKGALNKTTTIAKDAIATAAEKLGGVERLVEWAKQDDKNESAFWTTIFPKLLPLQVSGDPDQPIVAKIVREIVRPESRA